MSNECTYCSASFHDEVAFERHLEDLRYRETYHSLQLDHCRAHLIANSDEHPDNAEDGNHRLNGEDDTYGIIRICPHIGCTRTREFGNRQTLRRHFQQHVACEEVCVFCFKVTRTVREFIRHAQEGHREEEKAGTKAGYMRKRCEELDCHVASELEGKIKAAAAAAAATVKRKWDEVADGVPEFDRPKRVAQPVEGTIPLLPYQPSTIVTDSTPNVEALTVAPDDFYGNTSTQTLYSNTIAADGEPLDAPILFRFGWANYDVGWTPETVLDTGHGVS